MKIKIGVLGGTFDPVHTAHLIVAEEARVKLDLNKVILLPAGLPWLKAERDITAPGHRLSMIKLAIANCPHFEVSALELEHPGPTYSVETLPKLKKLQGPGAELFFMLGMDTLTELPRWREPARLLETCRLVGFSRPGFEADLIVLEGAIPGLLRNLILLEVPLLEISSTMIRDRVAQGLPIRYMVPEAVEDYIKRHRLYVKGS